MPETGRTVRCVFAEAFDKFMLIDDNKGSRYWSGISLRGYMDGIKSA